MLNIFIVTIIIILSLYLSYYIFKRIRDYYRFKNVDTSSEGKKKGKKDKESIKQDRQQKTDEIYAKLDDWLGEWIVIAPEFNYDEP